MEEYYPWTRMACLSYHLRRNDCSNFYTFILIRFLPLFFLNFFFLSYYVYLEGYWTLKLLIFIFDLFSVNINMNSKRRKENSRRKVLVNVFPNQSLLIFSDLCFSDFRKVIDLSVLLNASQSYGLEGAQNGVCVVSFIYDSFSYIFFNFFFQWLLTKVCIYQ